MIEDLLRSLVGSRNVAADEVLVDALRVGSVDEQRVVLGAILARKSVRSLAGVVELYERLPEPLQVEVLSNIRDFHSAIREAGRSSVAGQRHAAMKLIAHGRQGKLAYVLSENLHSGDEEFGKAAAAAMASLARWVSRSSRWLNGDQPDETSPLIAEQPAKPSDQARGELYREIIENRPEIEGVIIRAMELHRGSRQQDLLHAALMLCDCAGGGAIRILNTAKHVGQSVMIRRIQQSPEPEHAAAFLLGATHGNLRGNFGNAFAKIEAPVVLDALLRFTHWLKCHQLKLCMHQVSSGVWWSEADLPADLSRRTSRQAAQVGDWIAASGLPDTTQDARLEQVLIACGDDLAARVRLLRLVMARPRGASTEFLKHFLHDSEPRLIRMAAREFIRRRPADFEQSLLPLLTDAPESVRKIVGRSIGQSGFERFWEHFDSMDRRSRGNAGKALLKILPDAVHRLGRRLSNGNVDQRLKALQMAQELSLVPELRSQMIPLCAHANPRVRSKAVSMLGDIGAAAVDLLIEKAVQDPDARVRANAIEVMEARSTTKFVPLLADRARSGANRERANAIKALHTMKVATAGAQLLQMLRDERADHRISALWALRRMGWWRLLSEVAQLARADMDQKVRRYAMTVLQSAVGEAKTRKTA